MQSMPERILLVFGKLNRGGAETLAMNIYRKIDRSKIQFDFIKHTEEKCDYDAEIRIRGGRIYSLPQYNVKNHFAYAKCWKEFFKEHPEYKVIHAHMTGSAAVFLPIAKKFGLYTISHSHIAKSQAGLRQKVIDMYQLPLRYISDYLFACSDIAGEWLFGKNVAKRKNYMVIKNGVDTDEFSYNAQWRDEIRNEFGLEGKFVLGNVSRFHIQKNHSFLIDIFYEVHKRNNNAALILVGDGELRKETENKVKQLGLEKSVVFAGVREDINKILSAMDVFVMPSFREGLPVALVEAQSTGVHIVATDKISDEIHLTDLIENCALEDGAKKWADTILKYSNGYERESRKKELQNAGYDIKQTTEFLENFYYTKSKGR